MAAIEEYLAPRTLEEMTRIAGEAGATILAGGTDLGPRWLKGIAEKPTTILDVKAIGELRGVRHTGGEISIGACTLMSELETDPIIRSGAPVLAEAAARVACPPIRNRATLGGNLCNASPAADTAVPLILLDAVLELASAGPQGVVVRDVPITDFFRGPGLTRLAPGELLTRVRFKPLPDDRLDQQAGLPGRSHKTGRVRSADQECGESSAFQAGPHSGPYTLDRLDQQAGLPGRSHRWFCAWDKFGTRPAMEIAVASVGVLLDWEDGVISHARVGYGSVAPVPLRGCRAEDVLLGSRLCDTVIEKCTAAAREEIAPITDVRASAAYRREILGVMLRRMLETAKRQNVEMSKR
jgi:CO/xanthine dehydrogenase FAD-binding subunit